MDNTYSVQTAATPYRWRSAEQRNRVHIYSFPCGCIKLDSRGGATGYAVYATAYPALLRCTGVNIRILLKKKEKTTPRVASVVASATSGRPSSHGPTQQRKQIGLVQFASLDSPARRHSCRSVFPIGRPQTAVAQIGDRLIVTFDSGIARHRASLFRTQSTKASPAIQDASTNRRKAPNSRKVSIFY